MHRGTDAHAAVHDTCTHDCIRISRRSLSFRPASPAVPVRSRRCGNVTNTQRKRLRAPRYTFLANTFSTVTRMMDVVSKLRNFERPSTALPPAQVHAHAQGDRQMGPLVSE